MYYVCTKLQAKYVFICCECELLEESLLEILITEQIGKDTSLKTMDLLQCFAGICLLYIIRVQKVFGLVMKNS